MICARKVLNRLRGYTALYPVLFHQKYAPIFLSRRIDKAVRYFSFPEGVNLFSARAYADRYRTPDRRTRPRIVQPLLIAVILADLVFCALRKY
jgi:hypothetical protein